MALKKPSEYFKKDIVTIDESVQEVIETSELNTFSDAFNSFKKNLEKIEVLSNFSDTLDNYRLNIEKVNYLSEKIEDINSEIQTLLKKEDLERAMLSQLLVVENSISDVQKKVKAINEKNLTEIRLDVGDLTKSVNEFIDIEVPKYKKLVIDSEIRTNARYDDLEYNVNQTLEGIGQFVESKYDHLTKTIQGINETSLASILQDFKILDESVSQLIEKEIPKYKGFIVENERKIEYNLNDFDQKVNKTLEIFDEKLETSVFDVLEKINSVETISSSVENRVVKNIEEVQNLKIAVNTELKNVKEHKEQLSKKVTDLEVEIIRNESHIKNQNNHIENIQEEVRQVISKLDIENLEEQNYELTKKIKYLEEVFEKFNEKDFLLETIPVEPSSVDNKDPLTPLDKNFVTLDQLQEHYRLFINRVQQQLATIGGGGETRLRYLDDIVGIATNASAYDGKYLKYIHSLGKFEFSSINSDDDSWVDSPSGTYTNANVGIGTSVPQYDLDVNGDINFNGSFYQNGSLFVASRWTAGIGNDIYRLNGNIGIGTTNPISTLDVRGDGYFTGIVTATDFNSASDINLKENISVIDNPLDKIVKLNGVNFNWKESGKKSLGVIAQEVEKVLPELVSGEESKTVNYNGIIGLLIECVKQQQKEIEELKKLIDK